jgi:gliding motility-associated-like protein
LSNGSIAPAVSGGTPGYTFVWSGTDFSNNPISFVDNTLQNQFGLGAGSYSVQVTDLNGCVLNSITWNITDPLSSPTIQNINTQPITCFGANTGSISFIANGGTPGYNVELDNVLLGTIPNAGGIFNIPNLTAGNYTLEIIDNNGCVSSQSITLTQPNAALSAVNDSVYNVTCNGLSTGAIFTSVTGGTAPYSYFWSVVGGVGGPIPPGQVAAQDPQGIPDGYYQVTVTDVYGCTTSLIVQVTEPAQITIGWQDSGPLCDGNSLGFINLQISGGTQFANAPIYNTSWQWAPLQNAGINCSATNIPNNTFSPTSLTCGIYTVTVTDANGCTAQYTDSIIITPTPFQANFSSTNIQCFGQTNGTITVTPTTGTAPFDVSITPNGGNSINPPGPEIFAINNGYTVNNLSPGTYLVTITDNNGCQDDSTLVIVAPQSPITATVLNPTDASCFGSIDGSFIVGISGGTAPYTINVDPFGPPPPFSSNLTLISNLSANTYSVTVLDVNQCSSSPVSVTISQPTLLTASLTGTSINCFGDCSAGISSAVSGGTIPYTYQWTSGANSWNTPNINNLCAGSYQFSLVDNNGCTFADSYTINQPASPMVVTVVGIDSLSCFGANDGQIVVAVNGGTPNYTVSLGVNSQNINPNINNTATFSNLGAGNYVLVVTDNNGCDTNINFTISSPPALTLSVVPVNILCAGQNTGALNLSVIGGVPSLTYVITGPSSSTGGINGSTSVSLLPAGAYTITVTDNNGCTSTVSSTISVPSPIQITETITNVLCQGLSTGQIITAVSGGAGGYTYAWVASNGGALTSGPSSTSQINIPAGTYQLTVIDANNCPLQETYVVTEPQLPLGAVISSFSNVTCGNQNNGQITVAISGGTPNYNINGIGATVVVNPAVGNTHQFSNLPGGNYALTITDANGCSVNVNQTITQPAPLTLGITSSNVACHGAATGSLSFTTSGGTAPINYTILGPPNSSGTIPTSSVTTTPFNSLPAGTYTVTLLDANGCTDTISTTITQPQPIVIQGTVTPILCFGQGAGAISTSTSGGVGPYTYLWSNSNPTPNITGVPAGPYTLTVTDANLCSSTQTWSVVQPPLALSINLSSLTNISCNGANDGSVQVTASGGTAGYQVSYQRTNPPGPLVSPAGVEIPLSGGTYPVGGLSAGNYTLTVVDANGCSIQDTFTIIEPPAFGATVSANTILCNPGNTGVLTITTPPGSYPVTYVINGPGGPSSGNINTSPFLLNNLPGGNYSIDLTYNNGLCSQQLSATINQPANPISVTPTVTNVPCAGVNSGSICLNVTGGTGPYSFVWSIPGNTSCQNNLAPGTYNVTVTDANNCSVPNTYTISGPVSPLVADSSFTNVLCLGQNDGTITITANGGSPTYTLTSATLLPASTTINLTGGSYQYTNVAAGTHTVLITDANGCTDSETITITQPQNPLNVVNLTATDVQCYGDMNGSIAFNVIGGTAPYTVVWSAVGLPAICSVPASTVTNTGIISATGLCQGSYSVNISDLNGCTYSFAQSIIAPNLPLTASATQTNILCHGQCTGVATTVPSGGTAPYQHSWSNGQTTPSITGLCIGDYYDTITDANGCEIIVQFSITAPAQPMVVTITDVDVDCFDNATGSITVSATGGTPGYNVSWTPGPPFPGAGLEILNSGDVYSIPGLLAGNYTVYVQDLNNCLDSQVVLISQPAALTYSIASTNVTCNGASNGSINVTVNGGVLPYTYLWNSTAGAPCSIPINQANATGLCPGIYDVLVTDANGCQINTGATITEPDLLVISVVNDTVYCLPGTGGSQANVSGGTPGYTINWQNASGTTIGSGISIANLAPGVYNAVVVDANGCQNTAPLNIIGPAAPLTVAISHTNETCINNNDGTITIIPSGGTAPFVITGSPWNGSPTVAVSGGNAVSNNMVAGSYTYTITDAYGCQITVSTTITQPTYLQVALQVTNVTCHNDNDGIIQITPSGSVPNYTVTWISGPNSGLCALPVTSIISGATSFNNLCPGVYVFSVTDANGCDTTLSATISEPQPLVLTPTSNDDPCNDANCQGSAGVSVTGGTAPYTYLWTGGASTSSVGQLCVGVYIVTVTDANGCDQSASVTINQPAQALSAIVTTTNETCNGSGDGTMTLTPNGGTAPYTIVGITNPWGGAPSVNFAGGTSTWTGISAGTYLVQITDAQGCQIMVSGTVTEPTPLAVVVNPSNVTCFGNNNGSIQLVPSGATTPYTVTWNSGPNSGPCALPVTSVINAATSYNGLCPGVYQFTVSDANGCSLVLNATITEPTPLSIALTSTDDPCNNGICEGSAGVSATGGTAPYSYAWTGGATTASINSICAGVYVVAVTDANGCQQLGNVTINQPALALSALVATTNETCNGSGDGTLIVTPNGGTAPYTIVGFTTPWGGPSNINFAGGTSTWTGVSAGTYQVDITDANGCQISVSGTVTEPTPLAVAVTPFDVTCYGLNNGYVQLGITGATPSYNLTWLSGPNTGPCQLPVNLTVAANAILPNYTSTNLCPGVFDFVVTDANGCDDTLSFTINEPPAIVLSATTIDVLCHGDASGQASITATGGTPGYTYNWVALVGSIPAGQATNQTIGTPTNPNGIPTGTYEVTVTDANGCPATETVNINQPATPLLALIDHTDELCFPVPNQASTGTITIGANGGTGPYTIAGAPNNLVWTGPSTIVAQSMLPPNPISGQTMTGVASNLASAPYVFTVTDFHGCTSTVSVTVGSPAALSVITTPTNILCNGNNDGAINVAPSGGVSPYNINWISGPTGPGCVLPVTLTTNNNVSTPPSLCPGTYVMDIVDANGCVLSTSETILEPANPVNINYSVNDVLCYGDSSGQISTQVSGGTGPYTYNWTTLSTWNGLPYGIPFPTAANQPPGNPNHPFGLPAGTYMVTVNDANGNSGGCHDEVIITITQPATPVAGTLTPHAVDCNSNATGSIDITASGGVGPYIVTRNNNLIGTILLPGGTITETGLIAGNYTYVITDANWCAITVTTIVSQPAPLVVSLNNVVDVSCIPGSFDGQIDLSVVGGNSYYSYNWTTAALPPFPLPLTTPVGGPSVSNLYPGIYTVTVTDLLGCQSTLQVTVNQFPGFTVTSTIGDIQCHGNNTGSINLTLNGGTPNFTFQWTGPNGYTSIFQNIIGLGVGQYNVIVTDGAGCVVPLVATISEPSSALTSTVVSSNVACYGDNSGSISISATGGTPFAGPNPYNYEWYLNGLLFSTAQSLTNLFPGIYVCHITDANGCLLTEQVVITQPATALTYSINTTDVTCFGGSNGAIDITVSGGTGAPYSLLWNTGETTEDLANLAAGTYTLTITDAGPCVVTTAPITIIQPTPIVITPSILNVGCHGDASGMITTQVSGGTVSISAGYTYLWSTVNGVIPAGQSTLPNIGSTTHPFGLTPGDYNLLVTDANGCTSSLVATVIQPLAPLYIASTYTNVDCFGDSSGSISVYAEGGTLPYNVSWSGTVAGDPFGLEILSNPGTYIISSLPAGTYNFQVVDQNGCSLAGGAVITQNSLIDTVNTAIDSVFCANSSDGFISVSITGGIPNVLGAPYNISWSGVDASGNAIPMLFTTVAGNTTTASNLVAGTYTLTVTDAINCTRTFTYVMTEVAVSLSNVVDNDILCKGQCTGEIEFIPTGGDATYTVTVFPIGQPAANTITITEQDLQGSATGIFSLGGLCPGQYYVLITDANNCSANTPAITITEPSTVFSPSVNVISNSGCNDNAGILNVQVMGGTPGYNVAWHNITDPNIVSPAGIEINQSPGNYLIIGLSSGFIEVLVTDNVGCEIVDTVEIDDTDVTFANFTALDSAGCGPFLAQFTNLSLGENLSYFWSFGNGQTSTEENPSVTFDVGGPYDVTLTVTNAFGCTSTMVESGYIVSYASPNAAFTISSTGVDYYSGLVEFINNSVNAQFYTWDFGHFSNGSTEVNPTYYYPQWTEGDYIVTLVATDTNGCSDQTQLLISSSETVRLNVPNTVTIDDNGLNELFFPVFSNFEEILNFKLEIFDRWGELIFETKDIQGGWDGTYRGVDVQSGTYTWKVTYKDLDGFDYQAVGHINVLR